jgi:hypothetical protein
MRIFTRRSLFTSNIMKGDEMDLRKVKSLLLPVLCCMTLAMVVFQAPAKCHGFEITIEVAPSTLNIQSQGQVVTVHTSIAFSSVVGGTVSLNGIPIDWWKADNQGNFVAKFLMSEVKALADTGGLDVPGENELTLVGYTTDGAEFTGSQTITVINVEPAGKR